MKVMAIINTVLSGPGFNSLPSRAFESVDYFTDLICLPYLDKNDLDSNICIMFT